MKKNNIFWIVMFCCFLIWGCKQITKSVDETFHPNDSLASKYNKEHNFGTNGEYTGTTKTTTRTTSTHQQETITVINGDTINMANLPEKAKLLFKDIEELKHKQVPANGKAIQNRVNEFLREMKLPHSEPKKDNSKKEATVPKKRFLAINELKQAETKLKQLPQYRDKEIMFFQTVYFYKDGTIRIMLQHPENPEYIDEYAYDNGKWSAPKPVQVIAQNLARRLFPLNKVDFENAVKVIQIYNEKASQVEGAKPSDGVYISVWDDRLRWFPGTINGTRERYDIEFNIDGSLKSFRKE